jgi:hypothetical protein
MNHQWMGKLYGSCLNQLNGS